MIIGVPKEIKNGETRISLTPASVEALVEREHTVFVQENAGVNVGFTDDLYEHAGAKIVNSLEEIYAKSEIVVKVKEPQPVEYGMLKTGQTLLTYLHLAVEPELTSELLKKKITAIAYETIQCEDGRLPLLHPMSEIAGKMSIQVAAKLLENSEAGNGILIGGVPGVAPAEVLIVGAGTVGLNAAKIAAGVGASVTILDICPEKLAFVDNIFNGRVKTAISNRYNIAKFCKMADVLVSAVLIPGAKAPVIITKDIEKTMKKGSVIIDVSIDQGGIVESVKEPTSIEKPYFVENGVIHYAVPNIPGLVGRSATISLNNYSLPYIMKLADKGFIAAVKSTPEMYKGVNTYQGKLVNQDVAEALGLQYTELSILIGF